MQPFSLPAPIRLSACFFVFAWLGVDAQTPGANASPVCDGSVTVTWMPPPFTVTVYTSGTFNASSLIPDATSLPSIDNGASSLVNTGIVSGLSTLSSLGGPSLSGSLSVPSEVLPTTSLPGVPSVTTSPLLSGTPSVSLSLPSVSASLTVPSLTTPSSVVPGVTLNSDLTDVLTTSFSSIIPGITTTPLSVPTISISDNTVSLSLPSVPSLSGTPSITLSAPTVSTSLPAAQISSLSNVLSTSVTLPAVSLSSGLTTLTTLGSTIPSLSSPTLSLSLPTLSLTTSLSVPSTSVAIPTGLSTSLSSVTVSPSLPSISLSVTLSSLSLPGGSPTLSISLSSVTVSPGLPTLSTLSLSLPGGSPTLAPSRSTLSATAIPTASVLALVYCPGDNGLSYLSPDNRPYQIECNMRRLGNVLSQKPEPDLQNCINSCDDTPGCQSVSYNPADGTCSAEDGNSSGDPDNDYLSAKTVDLSCPGADTTQYMDSTGSVYQVLCDYNFPQSQNITTAPGADYLDCSSTCSKTATCTGFSYSNGVCTFTQGFGDLATGTRRNGANTVVMLAKRAVRVGPDGKPITDTSSIASVPRLSLSRVSTTLSLPSITSLGTSGLVSVTTISPVTLPTSPSLSLTSITSINASSLLGVTTVLTGSLATSPSLSLPSVTVSSLSIVTPPSLSSLSSPIVRLSSATIPTSQGPTQTPVSYACPANDGRVVFENGLSYILNCSSTTDGIAYSSKQAATSFNDCFRECDQSSTAGGANYCTAFTYDGAEDGSSSGTCYLYNGVSQGFLPTASKKTITAIRAVNYVPAAAADGVSSLLSGVPSISVSVSATVAASVTVGAGVGVGLPSISGPSLTSSLGSLVTLPTSNSLSITGTCSNGGNILNGCVLATATLDPGVGASGGVVIGPSSSPILGASLSASVGVSVSAGVGAGVGLSAGSSGLSLGVSASMGLGLGGSAGAGGGLGLGGAATTTPSSSTRASATPGATSPSTASTTSYYVTPLGPVVTTTTTPSPSLSTTTVYTTSTITSCLTGVGGVLTCPLGGLFTTLSSTSGAVTSISTSISTSTSISVSISYVTVTASSSSSSSQSSSFSTITTFSSRTSSSSSSRSSSTSSACAGVVNAAGLCVL